MGGDLRRDGWSGPAPESKVLWFQRPLVDVLLYLDQHAALPHRSDGVLSRHLAQLLLLVQQPVASIHRELL